MGGEDTQNPQGAAAVIRAEVGATVERLRGLTQVEVQGSWWQWQADLELDTALEVPLGPNWAIAPLNGRNHIAWAQGKQVLWLRQELILPGDLQGYPLAGLTLRLALTWWAEQAEIFVNRQRVQVGDLFDHSARVLLSPAVQPGERFSVALRLVSPDHDPGALVKSCLMFEPSSDDRLDPGMVAVELEVLRGYLQQFEPEKLRVVAAAIQQIDWAALGNAAAFEGSLQQVRQHLTPLGQGLKQQQIGLLGHAHLDLAWLWPVSDTWEVAERTFESVLSLQADFPELIFAHSSPALFAWIEAHRPALFAAIQQQVAAGTWEIVAGMWVEPELNLISGESLVRQVLYGQRYVYEKFGAISAIAWLPDSFGFCWQLPQILRQGGVEYFVTQKLRWNDTSAFPHEAFWWRSPDGSEIFSVITAPIGEGIEPVKMAEFARRWQVNTGTKLSLWLPGVGDHGGGPTRDMLEVARRWQDSPLFPQLKFTTAHGWLGQVQAQQQEFPVWADELYLEFHRGCYTTHADQKRANRFSEHLLTEAELFAALATLATGQPYPQAELERAWKQVLFNQFHDILPGSAIPQVFEEANHAWTQVQQLGETLRQQAWQAIARQISLPPAPAPQSLPLLVFNSLNWDRTAVVRLPLPPALSALCPQDQHRWQVYDLTGQPVPTQWYSCGPQPTLLFWATEVPSLGYRLFWLRPTASPNPGDAEKIPGGEGNPPSPPPDWTLKNRYLEVEVDPTTGNLTRVFDRLQQREILSGPGNQLQFFRDQGQYWDAWNIDPDYAKHPLPAAALVSIEWLAQGPLEQRLRVQRQFGRSQFCQDYVLEAETPLLKIATTVQWQERQVLVKAAFPLTWSAPQASYEIPCGTIQRPTLPPAHPLPPAETARWEVPALHWADLTGPSPTGTYGLSLLNDCKYGYDAHPNQLRLTLLRSPNWPDPQADLGEHQFTYGLYPHAGGWQEAATVHRGYELNRPLQAYLWQPAPSSDAIAGANPADPAQGQTRKEPSPLPPVHQFLDLQPQNLILMALKQAEANPNHWILRCYECSGEPAVLQLTTALPRLPNPEVDRVDLLERPDPPGNFNPVPPWRIVSLRLRQGNSMGPNTAVDQEDGPCSP